MKKTILIIILLAAGTLFVKSQPVVNYDTLSTFKVLQTGLDANFSIKLKKHIVGESLGQLISTKGFFNPVLSFNFNGLYGTDPTWSYINSYIFTGQVSIPTRLGIKFYSGVRLYTEQQIQMGVPGVFETQYLPINESGMWAGVSLPLLRDLGRYNTENVTYLSTLMMNKAQNVSFTDEICQFIKNTLVYYYSSYSTVAIFKILKDADNDARQYLSDIKTMISDEQLAKAEAFRAEAYQLNIAQQFSLSRNDIVNSLYDLVTSIGAKGTFKANTLPVFLDSLPDPVSFPWDQYSAYVFRNVDSMVVNTPYYKSQELLTSSSLIAMNGAKHNRLNELNLNLNYMYFGMTNGMPVSEFTQTLQSGSPGSSVNLTLLYNLPFKNEERKGDYLTKLSSYEFNKTQLEQVKFDSKMQVIKLLSDLGNLLLLYKHQIRLAEIEKKTFQSEVQKFKMGTSTQINLINTYMDYNTALKNVETGRLGIMTRVITLKYLIGDFPTSSDQLVNYNPWVFSIK